ncbi:hypothetical protein SFRURICE_014621, partial [Spodoptera frugiperda]
ELVIFCYWRSDWLSRRTMGTRVVVYFDNFEDHISFTANYWWSRNHLGNHFFLRGENHPMTSLTSFTLGELPRSVIAGQGFSSSISGSVKVLLGIYRLFKNYSVVAQSLGLITQIVKSECTLIVKWHIHFCPSHILNVRGGTLIFPLWKRLSFKQLILTKNGFRNLNVFFKAQQFWKQMAVTYGRTDYWIDSDEESIRVSFFAILGESRECVKLLPQNYSCSSSLIPGNTLVRSKSGHQPYWAPFAVV